MNISALERLAIGGDEVFDESSALPIGVRPERQQQLEDERRRDDLSTSPAISPAGSSVLMRIHSGQNKIETITGREVPTFPISEGDAMNVDSCRQLRSSAMMINLSAEHRHQHSNHKEDNFMQQGEYDQQQTSGDLPFLSSSTTSLLIKHRINNIDNTNGKNTSRIHPTRLYSPTVIATALTAIADEVPLAASASDADKFQTTVDNCHQPPKRDLSYYHTQLKKRREEQDRKHGLTIEKGNTTNQSDDPAMMKNLPSNASHPVEKSSTCDAANSVVNIEQQQNEQQNQSVPPSPVTAARYSPFSKTLSNVKRVVSNLSSIHEQANIIKFSLLLSVPPHPPLLRQQSTNRGDEVHSSNLESSDTRHNRVRSEGQSTNHDGGVRLDAAAIDRNGKDEKATGASLRKYRLRFMGAAGGGGGGGGCKMTPDVNRVQGLSYVGVYSKTISGGGWICGKCKGSSMGNYCHHCGAKCLVLQLVK